jgi:hypothetical protein
MVFFTPMGSFYFLSFTLQLQLQLQIAILPLQMLVVILLPRLKDVRNGGSLKRAFIFTNKEVTEHSNRRSDTEELRK